MTKERIAGSFGSLLLVDTFLLHDFVFCVLSDDVLPSKARSNGLKEIPVIPGALVRTHHLLLSHIDGNEAWWRSSLLVRIKMNRNLDLFPRMRWLVAGLGGNDFGSCERVVPRLVLFRAFILWGARAGRGVPIPLPLLFLY